MPYKSEAQRRLFNSKNRPEGITDKDVEEWNKETKGKKLPEKVKENKGYSEKTLKMFITELNDMFGNVEICGNTYPAGYALYKVDGTEFMAQFKDYIDLYGELK